MEGTKERRRSRKRKEAQYRFRSDQKPFYRRNQIRLNNFTIKFTCLIVRTKYLCNILIFLFFM